MAPRRRSATSTSNFGVGRRESHVADAFYSRFEAPELSADEHVNPHRAGLSALHGDARRMDAVQDDSVALVVTSPPYFNLKSYASDAGGAQLGRIEDYEAFLDELDQVWRECERVLVPGGRVCCVIGDILIPRRALRSGSRAQNTTERRSPAAGEIRYKRQAWTSGFPPKRMQARASSVPSFAR